MVLKEVGTLFCHGDIAMGNVGLLTLKGEEEN